MNESIIRGISDVGEQLQGISEGVIKIAEKKDDNKYFDDTLAEKISEIVSAAVKQLMAGGDKKYFDETLGEVISKAITDGMSNISKLQIDVTPVMRIAADISNQNRSILEAIRGIPKPETNDEKYNELLRMTLTMIEKTNRFMQIYLEKQSVPVIQEKEQKPASWEFKHKIEYNRIVSTTATPKYQ